MTQRHKLLSLVSGITNHQALISSSNVKFVLLQMDWLSNIWTLLVHSDDDNSCLVIHTDIVGIIANFLDGLSCDLLEVDFSLCMNLSEDHTDGVFDWAFTGDFWIGILSEAGVKNGVWNVVTKFIGVATCNIFWGKEEMSRFDFVIHWKKSWR